MNNKTTFGERLTDLLTDLNGNNQSELARYVGVSPQAVQFWAGGEVISRGKNIEKIAFFLKTTPAYLLYGTNPSDSDKKAANQAENVRRTGYAVEVAQDEDDDFFEIPYYYAKGSCGGGTVNYEDTIKATCEKKNHGSKNIKSARMI